MISPTSAFLLVISVAFAGCATTGSPSGPDDVSSRVLPFELDGLLAPNPNACAPQTCFWVGSFVQRSAVLLPVEGVLMHVDGRVEWIPDSLATEQLVLRVVTGTAEEPVAIGESQGPSPLVFQFTDLGLRMPEAPLRIVVLSPSTPGPASTSASTFQEFRLEGSVVYEEEPGTSPS